MGAQTSKQSNTSNSVLNVVASTIVNQSNSCASSAAANQNVSAKAAGDITIGDVSQSQKVSLNFSCFQDSSFSQETKNQIQKNLEAYAQSQVSGFAVGYQATDNQNITNSINNITNNLSLSSINDCSANVSASMNINVESTDGKVTIGNITQEQGVELVAKCVQQQSAVNTSMTQLDEQIKQSSQSSIAGILSGSVWMWVGIGIALFIGFLIFCFVAYKLFSKSPVGKVLGAGRTLFGGLGNADSKTLSLTEVLSSSSPRGYYNGMPGLYGLPSQELARSASISGSQYSLTQLVTPSQSESFNPTPISTPLVTPSGSPVGSATVLNSVQ